MLLCVDSDSPSRERTARALREAGFDTVAVGTLAAARKELDGTGSVECLVTEQDLPDGTGLELVAESREAAPDATCILFTDVPLEDIDTAAFGDLVVEYLSKDGADSREELVSLVEDGSAFRRQTAYPLPDEEDARLEALERYAADPEALGASFDRLTELATELFDVDAAAVGLVDAHEERFLACHGISLDPLPREETVCTYTILDGGVTVIEDAGADPRFDENQGLMDAGIRFYASAPLVTPEGQTIGTFCIYNGRARPFSDRDRELLELLAAEAMDQLELRGGGTDE